MGLELCERHFDRIEVRAIRRQEEELGSTLLEDSLGLYALVAGKVVEDHHVALLRRRGELGLEIGVEDLAIHGLVDLCVPKMRFGVDARNGGGRRPNTSYGTEMLHMAKA
jgi:hypothetical protein